MSLIGMPSNSTITSPFCTPAFSAGEPALTPASLTPTTSTAPMSGTEPNHAPLPPGPRDGGGAFTKVSRDGRSPSSRMSAAL